MKGSMLKKSARKPSARKSSPSKVMFQDPVGHALPASLHSFRWNVDKVERKLQEKIQEKTKIAGNFVYQQAYRLLECTRGEGIDYVSFKEQLRIKFGIILEDGELQLLFDKYDEDRNGTIDLNEFIRRVLPPDYNYGRQWFEISQQQSDEKQAALKRESRNEFLMGMGVPVGDGIDNTGEASNWTLETLMKHIQTKVVQKTPSGDDQYRRAFKMLRSGRDQGIRIKELRNNLKTKFGIFISEKQMKDLFSQFDMDGSGEIDLKEFLQFVEPPAYPGNSKVPSGIWTAEPDDSADEGEGSDEEEDDHGVDHHHHHRNDAHDSRTSPYERPDSARATAGNSTATANAGGSGAAPSSKHPVKKERPMSANPKKAAMLKQRREQMSSTSQLHMKETESRVPPQGRHSVTKATQTQARRMSMSLADIHATQHLDRLAVSGDRVRGAAVEADCQSVYSGVSANTLRPRSAGSVTSSRPSSAASASSSVRGASYMRRPSTPQYLRQKCLESRVAGVAAADPRKDTSKFKKRASVGPATRADQAKANAAKRGGATHDHHRTEQPRRHTFSDTSSVHSDGSRSGDEYDAPRVVRVHPKQHDNRPFSQEGRVLLRNKVSSAGCR